MGNEIEQTKAHSPAQLILQAVGAGADLEKLGGLLELQEKYEANEARKAYHKAMAAFKANPPKIEKDKKVSFKTGSGVTEYNHASLANVTEKINKSLSEHGLSASWTTAQNGQITVTCKITHELGHSEETSLTGPADTSGSKNPIQQMGSSITYLQRYTLLALTGLATSEMDDDGNAAITKVPITDEQFDILSDWMASAKATEAGVCKALGIASFKEMDKKLYDKAIIALKATVERAK